jgi:hypothetical protein
MQEKEIVMVRYKEDREKLINKLKYPVKVYCTGPNPEKSEISIPNIALETYGYIKHIIDNYDNLSEYTIFSQADPDPHVESFELAIDSTFTSGFGSFCYARSFLNQYASNWDRLLPLKPILNYLDINFINDNNCSKNMFCVLPGVAFYVHRDRIRKRPKSFYQKILEICNDDIMVEMLLNYNYPNWFWNDVNVYHPELKSLPRNLKLKQLIKKDTRPGYIIACSFEALWFTLFQSEENLNKINLEQAMHKNIFSSNTKAGQLDSMFFKLLENDWFDWSCPNYLKWREKLLDKTINETAKLFNFNPYELLNHYEKTGYKHISF